MCRFLAYSGPPTLMQELLLDSAYSLVRQSRHARMRFEPVNGDGFGVGWYPQHDDPEPGTFVSVEPAWSNRNLREIAAKILTPHFFAHVRDATPGMPVSQANCHPFKHGPWLWMHNGFLGEFHKTRRYLLEALSDEAFESIQGNTDSEHAFALFLDAVGRHHETDADKILAALNRTLTIIHDIRTRAGCRTEAPMNFAVSNGTTALFTRYSELEDHPPPTLHYAESAESIIVASEPLSDSDAWQEVGINKVLIVEKGKAIVSADLDP